MAECQYHRIASNYQICDNECKKNYVLCAFHYNTIKGQITTDVDIKMQMINLAFSLKELTSQDMYDLIADILL